METNRIFIADFETEGIDDRPRYPPLPVGLALWVPGQKPFYHAWGHPTHNNSSKRDAVDHYNALRREGRVPVFHHAGFDLDVMETHCGVGWTAEHHDTLILLYQHDPRAASFSLKPAAERLLGEAPTERDELKEWIIQNVDEAKRKKTEWGAYISRAPGDLVGRYACGDVTRTGKLFKKFLKEVISDPLQRAAYERERALTRVLVRMERRGVPVATQRLRRDIPRYERMLKEQETILMDWLKVPKTKRADFKFSGDTFADQLERRGLIKEWILTEKNQRSTSVDSLKEVGVDPKLVHELEVRSTLATCLSTFMKPWHESGEEYDGRFYARFNQVRQDYHGGGGKRQVGTATGRLSMSPNLQNAPRDDKDKRLPRVRSYIVPGELLNGKKRKGLCIVQRDYSQQELRILAHYENGPFLAKYRADPTIDAHNAVKQLIAEQVGIMLERRDTKDLNFGLIYGMGAAKTALKINRSLQETRKLIRAHMKSLPGVKMLKDQLIELESSGEPLYTWGGRKYYCEKPKYVEKMGRTMTFGYKLLNVKIQGSAADCTKQAMLNYYEAGYDDEYPLFLQVHDELLALAPWTRRNDAHKKMREAMMDVDFNVPMLSDGKVAQLSWADGEKVSI
jgi:DNA polymerase I-like protein with 3'-5' exonuclease and polymerase domains